MNIQFIISSFIFASAYFLFFRAFVRRALANKEKIRKQPKYRHVNPKPGNDVATQLPPVTYPLIHLRSRSREAHRLSQVIHSSILWFRYFPFILVFIIFFFLPTAPAAPLFLRTVTQKLIGERVKGKPIITSPN
ncbi:hypothetical protein J3E69DRAFT_333774 [Trichoderma sp. SZMC 28015]